MSQLTKYSTCARAYGMKEKGGKIFLIKKKEEEEKVEEIYREDLANLAKVRFLERQQCCNVSLLKPGSSYLPLCKCLSLHTKSTAYTIILLCCKDIRFLKIAHFEKILEIKYIYDLDKNFYGNSHCVNAFQASRYLCFGQKIISNF